MYSFFELHNYNCSTDVKFHVPTRNIQIPFDQKCRLSKTQFLSIGIFAIIVLLPIPVKAHLTSREFPTVISETVISETVTSETVTSETVTSEISHSQVVEQHVKIPVPPSSGDSPSPIPVPTPTISPSIPKTPEDIPQIPEESPQIPLPEDIEPFKPISDINDDIPQAVPSNNLPSGSPEKSSSGNLLEVAAASNSLDIFARAIEAAGLTDTIIEDSFTVFAPTNEAFNGSLPPGAMEFLLRAENKKLLQRLLRNHVVKGEIATKELTTGKLDTLGGSIAIRVTPERIILNDSSITHSDIPATNGVIHSINRVLISRELRNKIAAEMSEKSDVEQP